MKLNKQQSVTPEVFWESLESLVASSKLVIDRPKGTYHPNFPEIIYPVDYGYLENTTSMDGHGIDVWRGSKSSCIVDTVMLTIDLMKKDSEIKILLGCTVKEKHIIMAFHNQGDFMKGILINRKKNP
jgi:inorganic pyrophosphatase